MKYLAAFKKQRWSEFTTYSFPAVCHSDNSCVVECAVVVWVLVSPDFWREMTIARVQQRAAKYYLRLKFTEAKKFSFVRRWNAEAYPGDAWRDEDYWELQSGFNQFKKARNLIDKQQPRENIELQLIADELEILKNPVCEYLRKGLELFDEYTVENEPKV